MLPTKWKIFRFICYLHVAAAVGMLFYFFLQKRGRYFEDSFDTIMSVIYLLCMVILISNALLNTLMLERYYPSRKPGNALNAWHMVLFVLVIIILSFLTFAITMILIDTINDSGRAMNNNQQFFLAIYYMVLLTGVPMCFLQVSLRRTIRRNHQREMDDFLTIP